MQQGGIDPTESSLHGREPGRSRRHWLAGGALCLVLLCISACAGTTGAESAQDLEEREAESNAEEESNRRR